MPIASCSRLPENEREPLARPRTLRGGRYRTRTDDLFRVKEARYQLRYIRVPPGCPGRLNDCIPRSRLRQTETGVFRLRPRGSDAGVGCSRSGAGTPEARGCSAVGSASPCQVRVASSRSRHPLGCRDLFSERSTRGSNHGGVAELKQPAKPFARVPSHRHLHLGPDREAVLRAWRSGAVGTSLTRKVTGSIQYRPPKNPLSRGFLFRTIPAHGPRAGEHPRLRHGRDPPPRSHLRTTGGAGIAHASSEERGASRRSGTAPSRRCRRRRTRR